MSQVTPTRRKPLTCLAATAALLITLLGSCELARAAPPSTPASTSPEHAHHDATVRHSFHDVAHWTAVFDDPARDAWQKPRELLQALAIRPGMCVADIGAGTGYFSPYLSAAVGDTGTVLAADTEPNLVKYLRDRAEREHTANVVPILASPSNPRLPAGAVDLIVIVDTAHHIDDRINYFRRLERVLKPGGRVAVIDFKKEDLPVGPPLEHKLDRADVVEEFRQAGYALVGEPDLLPYQYVLIFRAQ
jgi:ubiquinone/menaquinone biosynthesis C-methylase UbiE